MSHTCFKTTSASKGTWREKILEPLAKLCSWTVKPLALLSSTVRTPVEKVMFLSSTSWRKVPKRTLNTRVSGTVSEEQKVAGLQMLNQPERWEQLSSWLECYFKKGALCKQKWIILYLAFLNSYPNTPFCKNWLLKQTECFVSDLLIQS